MIYYLITDVEEVHSLWFFLYLFMWILKKVYPRIRPWIKATLPDLTRRKHSSIVYLKCTTLVAKLQKHNLSKSAKRTQMLMTVKGHLVTF